MKYGNIHTPVKNAPSMKKKSSARVPYSKRNIISTPANTPRRKA